MLQTETKTEKLHLTLPSPPAERDAAELSLDNCNLIQDVNFGKGKMRRRVVASGFGPSTASGGNAHAGFVRLRAVRKVFQKGAEGDIRQRMSLKFNV